MYGKASTTQITLINAFAAQAKATIRPHEYAAAPSGKVS
jgi:hypothetical protein